VAEAGCAIAAQSERLVPADKRIYALRDRTATVDSPGLIATSIVSKKIAGGAPSIVYDVKTGRGALLARSEEAEDLARSLVALTRAFGRRAAAVISDMNEPLGTSIGTGLEAIEARDFLRGVRRDPRLAGVCTTLATTMLSLADFSGDASAAVEQALASGAAAERFERMLRAQGAHAGALDALQPHASAARAVAEGAGIVLDVDAVALGELARELVLRAGPLAGIIVEARIGDRVARGDTLARVYGEPEFAGAVARAFILGDGPVPSRPLIYDVTS
jgi:thymidine phosphorylase